MQHALILTKNKASELETIGKLERLNYETLCSADLLYHIRKYVSSSFFSYFHWIFLSETLCNEEVDLVLNHLKNQPIFLVRIVEKPLSDEDAAYWEGKGISGFLVKEASFEEMREKMHELKKRQGDAQAVTSKIVFLRSSEKNELELLMNKLSKTEKKLFENLLAAYSKGIILSRVELCELIWSDGATPSNMSQLSCLINKLKHKLEENGITGETIVTLWGRGYKLGNEFSEFLIQNSL